MCGVDRIILLSSILEGIFGRETALYHKYVSNYGEYRRLVRFIYSRNCALDLFLRGYNEGKRRWALLPFREKTGRGKFRMSTIIKL